MSCSGICRPGQKYTDKSTALGNLAHMYFNLARSGNEPEQNFERAQNMLQQAIDQTRDQFGDSHPRLGGVNMYNGAGTIAMTLGQTERALGSLQCRRSHRPAVLSSRS